MELIATQFPTSLIGENYNITLKHSIQNLISETHKKSSNFSNFINIFYELMQAKTNPPLETIWVYSALSFRSREMKSEDISDRVVVIEELFRLITACSASCSGKKSIALLAPIVFELYELVIELSGCDFGSKRVKKVIRKVKSLIGIVIGYVSLCGSENLSEGNDLELIFGVKDLVNVWKNGNLKEFFPLVSDDIRREVNVGGCSVSFLAGVVNAEVFLLKLCFDLLVGTRGMEFEKEMRSWVVGSITGFQSFYFYDALARMMLEPTLPVTSILSSEDEIFTRKLLYDATVLVDYSFLHPGRTIHLPAKPVASLAVRRLIITHQAIEFFRKAGDQKRAVSCSNSYSSSRLRSQIVECVTNQIGSTEEASRLNGSSAKCLIKWLRALEGQGIRLFDDGISKHLAKLYLDDTKSDLQQTAAKLEGNDDLFYIDNEGDEAEVDEDAEEANESVSAAFVAAARSMSSSETVATKRKEGESGRKKKRAKLLKYDHSEDSDSDGEGSSSASENNDSLNTESEVENPTSDEEV